jgi:hypothetical protein
MTTATAQPPHLCTRRPLRDQRAAELAWARLRRLDPDGSADLAVSWCSACLAFHLCRRPRPPSRADERPIRRAP